VAKYSGRNGVIYLGTGTASAVGQLDSWSIDRKTDRVETTCMGDGNKTYIQGFPDMTGQFSGYWDAADDALFDAAEAAAACNMYIYPSSTTSTVYFYGTAFVDASVNGSTKDAVKVSGSWAAASTWGRKP
jgi:hypothetical protein